MGYVKVTRGWRDKTPWNREPFSKNEAWLWLIEEANWKDGSRLKRGQLSHSIRHMAGVWKWDKSKVSRFIFVLKNQDMIETASETGQTVITICNYDKYQSRDKEGATPDESKPRRERDSSETIHKKGRRKEEEIEGGAAPPPAEILELPKYRFQGDRLRLNQKDFDKWQAQCPDIPDLELELGRIDYHISQNPEKYTGNAFWPALAMLKKRNDRYAAEKREADRPYRMEFGKKIYRRANGREFVIQGGEEVPWYGPG